jgi:hypothetical protein
MPRGPRRAEEPSENDLEALIAAAGEPEPPKDLGNLPAESDVPDEDETPPEPKRAAEPEPAEESDEEEAEEEPGAVRLSAAEVAQWQARVQALEREAEMLRRGVVQPAQVPEIGPETILPFNVSEEDVATILQGGPRAAEMVLNALRVTALAATTAAERRLAAAYQIAEAQKTQGQTLREEFWRRHGDLAPVADLVQAAANTVYAEHPTASAENLIEETARRVRARVKQLGVRLGPAAETSTPRRRPATAETSGGARGNGRSGLSAFEKELFQLATR